MGKIRFLIDRWINQFLVLCIGQALRNPDQRSASPECCRSTQNKPSAEIWTLTWGACCLGGSEPRHDMVRSSQDLLCTTYTTHFTNSRYPSSAPFVSMLSRIQIWSVIYRASIHFMPIALPLGTLPGTTHALYVPITFHHPNPCPRDHAQSTYRSMDWWYHLYSLY